jgi:hypothetical protein
MDQLFLPLRIAGCLAILGAFLYAIGDVLLLASKVDLAQYPKLVPYAKLLSDAEKMIVLSPARLMSGALIGVFSTPLVMAGYWLMYQGLAVSGSALALIAALLFGISSVVGAFVHGSFYYLGEYVHALNKVDESSQPVIVDMFTRHRRVMIYTYAPLLLVTVIASILFSVLVAQGQTAFPVWMAAVNPVTLTIVWMLGKRILPQFIRDWTEGAGFNIAFLVFFICTTLTLWNGI